MWTRHDFLMLSAAAVATCGITLAIACPRLANAVDQPPAATVEIRVPALDLGATRVTAANDEKHTGTVILTVTNAADKPSQVEFLAQLMESPPTNPLSRRKASAQPVWNQEYACTLAPRETQTIRAVLPAATPDQAEQKATNLVPANRYLTLSNKTRPNQSITAVDLPTPKAPS
jgi:hypothetical protein